MRTPHVESCENHRDDALLAKTHLGATAGGGNVLLAVHFDA